MSDQVTLEQFDDWVLEESDVAALTTRQWLVSVEGREGVVFPPTYAKPERVREEDWLGYNLDVLPDGTTVCQIDSVGSQANRVEPIFKRDPYRRIVPQVVIRTAGDGGREINLLDAGHRAADAIVRFSALSSELEKAFQAVKNHGNSEQLAKIAPTTLVFGAWDSRVTQVKLPRIVRSVIRAFDAQPLHRSAQYTPPVAYVEEGLLDAPENATAKKSMSELGLLDAPAPWTHGGVQVRREIRRDATLNLVALRALAAASSERTIALRRYILGLSLVSLTATQDYCLREGCQLVHDLEKPAEWKVVRHDGRREDLKVTHDDALAYAELAARHFGVGQDRQTTFDATNARSNVGQSKDERKKAMRGKSKVVEREGKA